MKVNSLSDLSAAALAASQSKAADKLAAAPKSESSPSSEAGVTVSLSPVTQVMTNNVARSPTDVFNAEKVQAVREAIQNGSFSVNPEAIADKLLSNAREMLGVASGQ